MWHQTVGKLEISASDLGIEKILELGRRVVAAARGLSLSHADSFNTENFAESITCEKRRLCACHCGCLFGFGFWGERSRREREGRDGMRDGRLLFKTDRSGWTDRFRL